MRNRGDVLSGLIRDYLEPAFTKRVAEVNEEDPDIRLRDVSIWLSGHSAVLTGLPDYPACIILVDGRTLRDPYTTEYRVSVGIGITADDPAYLERLGRVWEDILEDAIRSDWSLGGAVLDVDTGVSFTVGQVSGLYVIEADMTVQVDIGGFVYTL